MSAPGIRSQTSCDRLLELYVSDVFIVIAVAFEAAELKLIGVFVKLFTDVCLLIRGHLVELLQPR